MLAGGGNLMLTSGPTPTCPNCGSTSLGATGKGFGGGKALVGAALLGPAGLLAGFVGSQDVRIVCLACRSRLKPADLKVLQPPIEPLPLPEPTEEERFWEAERQRLATLDDDRREAEEAARTAELKAIVDEKGFSQSDVAWFGAEALAGPILERRRREAEESRLAKLQQAEEMRVASRRAALIASGHDPDAVPTVVPVRMGPKVQPGILKWPLWKKRP